MRKMEKDYLKNNYYVYAWYYISTGEIFHIGKGTGNRMYNIKSSRNNYFKNILNNDKENVAVRKIADNLYELDAYRLEKHLISFYKTFGWCKTNFHAGGQGGNHGNYGEEFRSKISSFAKTRVGPKNSNFGNVYSKEIRKRISLASKLYHKTHPLSEEHKLKM